MIATVICPSCQGSGREFHGLRCIGSGPDRQYVRIESACWPCDGKGTIPASMFQGWELGEELQRLREGTPR
jgi:DnaJ-class molecular chaperone